MLLGFLGDVHGHAFHAIAALATWQRETRQQFDLIIQVGDMACEPDRDQVMPDATADPHLTLDPAEADFARLLKAEGRRADLLRNLRRQFRSPIHFVRGNHEPFAWLRQLPVDPSTGMALVDPFDLFRYVRDGTIMRIGDVRIAFLGGVEERQDEAGLDQDAYARVLALGPGQIDVLVAHGGHYGTSIGFRGDVHGSRLMTQLLEQIQPAYFLFGHAHQRIGPGQLGRTTYLGLDGLLPSVRWQPDVRGLQPGSLAVLDTAPARLQPITDAWLSPFLARPFDFDS